VIEINSATRCTPYKMAQPPKDTDKLNKELADSMMAVYNNHNQLGIHAIFAIWDGLTIKERDEFLAANGYDPKTFYTPAITPSKCFYTNDKGFNSHIWGADTIETTKLAHMFGIADGDRFCGRVDRRLLVKTDKGHFARKPITFPRRTGKFLTIGEQIPGVSETWDNAAKTSAAYCYKGSGNDRAVTAKGDRVIIINGIQCTFKDDLVLLDVVTAGEYTLFLLASPNGSNAFIRRCHMKKGQKQLTENHVILLNAFDSMDSLGRVGDMMFDKAWWSSMANPLDFLDYTKHTGSSVDHSERITTGFAAATYTMTKDSYKRVDGTGNTRKVPIATRPGSNPLKKPYILCQPVGSCNFVAVLDADYKLLGFYHAKTGSFIEDRAKLATSKTYIHKARTICVDKADSAASAGVSNVRFLANHIQLPAVNHFARLAAIKSPLEAYHLTGLLNMPAFANSGDTMTWNGAQVVGTSRILMYMKNDAWILAVPVTKDGVAKTAAYVWATHLDDIYHRYVDIDMDADFPIICDREGVFAIRSKVRRASLVVFNNGWDVYSMSNAFTVDEWSNSRINNNNGAYSINKNTAPSA